MPAASGYGDRVAPPADRLTTYRTKRDFDATPEPAGSRPEPAPAPGGRFVVQRHRATRLHYDFRLEVDGVLASWAVPKGPTLDPGIRRQAIHVEDHPIEYFQFEGVIPKGEYGGGDVIVWDWGRWTPAKDGDPAKSIAKGELHFDLDGEKLQGRFVLVKTERSGARSKQEQWLLLHKHDDFAVHGWEPEAFPQSVKSGRTNDDVAASPESLWRSDLPASEAEQQVAPNVPSWDPPTDEELAALAALGKEGEWELQDHVLRLTNLDKVLFPGRDGEPLVTKRELIDYA